MFSKEQILQALKESTEDQIKVMEKLPKSIWFEKLLDFLFRERKVLGAPSYLAKLFNRIFGKKM